MKLTVYNTLYDWQKPFVDKIIESHLDEDYLRWGFFLRMGIGKTKIMVAAAEKRKSDCIIVTSIKSKVTEEFDEGSFGDELRQAGYEVFFSHKLTRAHRLDTTSDSKAAQVEYLRKLESAIKKGKKVAFVNNYENILTQAGYVIINVLGQHYNNISWLFDESHKLKDKDSSVTKRVRGMLYNKYVPALKQRRTPNYFKENIKQVFLGTGTPFTVGYEDFYSQLDLLGIDMNYGEFTERFLKLDEEARRYNPFAKVIKGYKDREGLLDLVESKAFFARTENYYPFLPERITTIVKVPRSESYDKMSNPALNNPHYRVLDGYIADTPSLFKLRLRQLASGFMGNAEKSDYYSDAKLEKLTEILDNNVNNYVIFYTYTPELFMIIKAAEDAGYEYELWNGKHKESDLYYDPSVKEKKLIIANIESGSTGLNRQKYNTVIFYSLPDTYALYDQGVGRVERIGQESDFVEVIVITMRDTVEDRIWKALMKGMNYTNKAFERDFIYKEDR